MSLRCAVLGARDRRWTRRAAWRVSLAMLTALSSAIVAAAPAAGATAGWDGFGVGSWPGAGWRPYASSSPFNQPIGRAAVHPRSAQLVANALQWGPPAGLVAGEAGTSYDYGHPVYYAQPTDPVYMLHPTESWGPSQIAGMRIRVPAPAQPAGGSDAHMTVVEPDGWEYDLWHAQPLPPGGGRLTFGWGGRLRIGGSGLDGHATAAHFAGLAGIIRPEELAAGRIDHALFIVLKCTGSGPGFGFGVHTGSSGTGSYVYPAAAGADSCGQSSADLPPLGARFQLAMSRRQISALGVPAWKRAILTALAQYGGYVGDTGGSGFGFVAQSSSTYTSFGAPDRLVQVARAAGIAGHQGRYSLDLGGGVDWLHYLRIVAPPGSPRHAPPAAHRRASHKRRS